MQNIYLTGDINLLNINDPTQPFRHLKPVLQPADMIFSNLECCFYDTARAGTVKGLEGFYVPTRLVEALEDGGITAVGLANNVNYGAEAIQSSCQTLRQHGIRFAGAGPNAKDAYQPIIVEQNGLKIGFLQRSSIFWTANHMALHNSPGIAVIKGHTAYQPTLPHKPGSPPLIHTWADPTHLANFKETIAVLRPAVDLLISSHHWGLRDEVLDYQVEIAHAAIDAGADVVMGHGAHMPLPIELYKGKPIFYGLAHLFFLMGHGGKRQTGDGLISKIGVENGQIIQIGFSMVQTTDDNESIPIVGKALESRVKELQAACRSLGSRLEIEGNDVVVYFESEE
ncbi:MAG: CapA family protein [Chloroflexota bacterium]